MKEIVPLSREDVISESSKPVPEHVLLKRELVNVLEGVMEAFEDGKIDSSRLYLEVVNVCEAAKQDPFLNLAMEVELAKRRAVFNEEREIVEQKTIEGLYDPMSWYFFLPGESEVIAEEFVLQRTILLKELFEGLFEE